MRKLWLVLALVLTSTSRSPALQASCPRAVLQEQTAISGSQFSLADLFAPDTCPELLHIAAQVGAGVVPRVGSTRVIPALEIDRLLGTLDRLVENNRLRVGEFVTPDRVTVRRSSASMSCAEFSRAVMNAPRTGSVSPLSSSPANFADIDCGPAERLPQNAKLEITKVVWDRGIRQWHLSVRCLPASDCVPFLVRVQGQMPASSPVPDFRVTRLPAAPYSTPRSSKNAATVKSGQKMTLLWEQSGIRMVVPVICLDAGAIGDSVRVRTKSGGRVLRAEVVNGAILRVRL